MADKNHPASSLLKLWLWRLAGFGIAAIYLTYGTVVVLAMLIAGLWEGFARPGFIVQFLLLILYVYGTASLAVFIALRQSKKLLPVLLVLLIPIIWAMIEGLMIENNSRELATIYASHEDPQETARAKKTLLEQGRRAGGNPAVVTLMEELEAAHTDQHKIHLIELLGELSYQYKPLLETLRDIRQQTQDDPQRQALYNAASEALLKVNPYEKTDPEKRE